MGYLNQRLEDLKAHMHERLLSLTTTLIGDIIDSVEWPSPDSELTTVWRADTNGRHVVAVPVFRRAATCGHTPAGVCGTAPTESWQDRAERLRCSAAAAATDAVVPVELPEPATHAGHLGLCGETLTQCPTP